MNRRVVRGSRFSQTASERWISALLEKIQQELPPGHDQDYVVINVESEAYVLGKTPAEAMAAYDKRWPHRGFHACRVDGGPFSKMYGNMQ